MDGLWLSLFFALGAVVGSFLNVVGDRLPTGKSIISPPSHCPGCQHRLSAGDMIPLFSYLWLKGRCRYCDATIPMRLFWVELAMGVLFAFLYWHYGFGWEMVLVALYCCLFVALVVTDLEHGILSNKIVYPGMAMALVAAILGSIFGFGMSGVRDSGFGLWIVDAAIGGGIGFGLLLIVALVSRGGMGGGDVKLAGLIGLVTGFPLVFVAMFLGVVSGGLVAGVLLVTKVKTRKETIPFGPFLCLAAMATLFWGNNLLAWYLGLS